MVYIILRNLFKICREVLHSHLLVKTSERLNVVKDVEYYVDNHASEVIEQKGYDCERLCSYEIKVVKNISADTIDYPLQVAIVKEKYAKERKDRPQEETFYIITSDLDLTPQQLIYAAHMRWRIENNGFKTMNHLLGTKKKKTKDETASENILWIEIIAMNLFSLFLDCKKADLRQLKGTVVETFKFWLNYFYIELIQKYSITQGFS